MATKKQTKTIPANLKKYQVIAEAVGQFANIVPTDVVFIDFAALAIHEVNPFPEGWPVTVKIPQEAFDQLTRFRQSFIMEGDTYKRPSLQYSVNGSMVLLTPPINDNQEVSLHGLTVPTIKALYYALVNYTRVEPLKSEQSGLLPIIHVLSEHTDNV